MMRRKRKMRRRRKTVKETKPTPSLKYQEVPAPSALGRWRATESKTPQQL
jgi:hypothetical protein